MQQQKAGSCKETEAVEIRECPGVSIRALISACKVLAGRGEDQRGTQHSHRARSVCSHWPVSKLLTHRALGGALQSSLPLAVRKNYFWIKLGPETTSQMSVLVVDDDWGRERQAFGTGARPLPGTPSRIRVLGFESRLCSQFQLSADVHPRRQQVMARVFGCLIHT